MALVAYGASDDSDISEDEQMEPIGKITSVLNDDSDKFDSNGISNIQPVKIESVSANILKPKHTAEIPESVSEVKSDETSKSMLFSSLPAPKKLILEVEEEEDEFLGKTQSDVHADSKINEIPKERKPVRIVLPSLNEIGSEDEKSTQDNKKLKIQYSKSGLFSLLPPPKKADTKVTNRILIPQTLANKQKAAAEAKRKEMINQKVRNPVSVPTKSLSGIGHYDDDDEDEIEEDAGFFNLNNNLEVKEEKSTINFFNLESDSYVVPERYSVQSIAPSTNLVPENHSVLNFTDTNSSSLTYEQWGNQKPEDADVQASFHQEEANSHSGYSNVSNSVGLSNEELMRLQGKRKRSKEELVFIDVKQDDHLAQREEWMLKALTEEKPTQSHSKNKGNMPTSQQRRKHQITYLAFQAKEREQDLKKEWAQNYQTKKQTQSKYGF